MSNYPTGWKDNKTQLLFDIGYSFAMLMRAEAALQVIAHNGKLVPGDGEVIQKLLEDFKGFREGRLQDIPGLYHAAAEIELPKK
jgi:hypothetical protein